MSPAPSRSPEEIIKDTLVKYTNLTGNDLVNDSPATEIKSFHSPHDIWLVFQQHARAFDDSSKLVASLKVIVDCLQALSTIPTLGKVAGLQVVCPLNILFISPS